jgi:hypothetical protein
MLGIIRSDSSTASELLDANDALTASFGLQSGGEIVPTVESYEAIIQAMANLVTPLIAATEEKVRGIDQRLTIMELESDINDVHSVQVLDNHSGGIWSYRVRNGKRRQFFESTFSVPGGNFILARSKIFVDPTFLSRWIKDSFYMNGIIHNAPFSAATIGANFRFPSGAQGKLHVTFTYDYDVNTCTTAIEFEPRGSTQLLNHDDLAAFTTKVSYTANALYAAGDERRTLLDGFIGIIEGTNPTSVVSTVGESFGLRGIGSYVASVLSTAAGEGSGDTTIDTVIRGVKNAIGTISGFAPSAMRFAGIRSLENTLMEGASAATSFVEEFGIPIAETIGLSIASLF